MIVYVGITRSIWRGPKAFVAFWLDTVAEWRQDTGKTVLVGLSCTKDVQDAILADPLAPGLMEQLKALSSPVLAHSGMAYAYAKKALKNYVADQAYVWGREGKRLVSLSPGLIDTEMGRLENAAMDNFEGMRNLIALGRLGDPQDIASAALFLVSEAAAYITGCDILVDGGFVAQ